MRKPLPDGKVKIVQVYFAGNYQVAYDFKTDLDLQTGDVVVCDTGVYIKGNYTPKFSIGKVGQIIDHSDKATKWVVQEIDGEAHMERLEREQQRLDAEIDDMLG
jgi:hypothetical protein